MNAERIKELADDYARIYGTYSEDRPHPVDVAQMKLHAALDELAAHHLAELNDRIENVARLNSELDAVRIEMNKIEDRAAENNVVPGSLTDNLLYTLGPRVVLMCKQRGWSLHWTHRGVYLHLEASELIEAIRGKRGDPAAEAGDVLLVLMSITEYAGIPFWRVLDKAIAKLVHLENAPHYPGEEYTADPDKAAENNGQDYLVKE